jgi:MoxR-like ATPase
MFNIWVDYPSFQEEVDVVKATTIEKTQQIEANLDGDQIRFFQALLRRMPVADNVINYAVELVGKTRPESDKATPVVKEFVSWGAGPRASQNLILAAKTHAAINGKFSPDIEDIKAIAHPVLRHRLIRNYKAEAEGYSADKIIDTLL